MPPPSSPHARWFNEEVLPNEPKLRAWLRDRFPTLPDVDDLIQETYARLFRSNKAGAILKPQAYLYATARNCAFDRLRHAPRALRAHGECAARFGHDQAPALSQRKGLAVVHEEDLGHN